MAPVLKVLFREDLHFSGTEVFHLGKDSLSLTGLKIQVRFTEGRVHPVF